MLIIFKKNCKKNQRICWAGPPSVYSNSNKTLFPALNTIGISPSSSATSKESVFYMTLTNCSRRLKVYFLKLPPLFYSKKRNNISQTFFIKTWHWANVIELYVLFSFVGIEHRCIVCYFATINDRPLRLLHPFFAFFSLRRASIALFSCIDKAFEFKAVF